MAQPTAFLFDMDGLLLDTERLYCAAFCETTQSFGVNHPEDTAFFHTLVGNSRGQTFQSVTDYLPSSVSFEHFLKEWEHAAHAQLAAEVPVKDTVRAVLSRLDDQGAVMAVVTSSQSQHAHENLERAGLLKFFKHLTGGDQVSQNKPHPAPYLETAAQLGVAPTACFAFEDSDKGITSAVRAGCRAVQVPDLRPPDRPFPDLGQHIADDLAAAMHHLGVF